MRKIDKTKLFLVATSVVAGVIVYIQVLKPVIKNKSEKKAKG